MSNASLRAAAGADHHRSKGRILVNEINVQPLVLLEPSSPKQKDAAAASQTDLDFEDYENTHQLQRRNTRSMIRKEQVMMKSIVNILADEVIKEPA